MPLVYHLQGITYLDEPLCELREFCEQSDERADSVQSGDDHSFRLNFGDKLIF